MEESKKKIKKTSEEIRDEIRELAKKADEQAYIQLPITLDFAEDDAKFEFKKLNLNTADPKRSYDLFYGIERLLKAHLPDGKSNKKLRDFVREEKNIFLNIGKKKNSKGLRLGDARQTFIDPFLEEAFQIVVEWVRTGSNPLDLYDAFYAANVKYGFQPAKEEKSENSL